MPLPNPTWLLPVAATASAFAVISREAVDGLSLSDMEELLRKRKRKDLLPRVEAFAEHLDRHSQGFLVLSMVAKAVTVVALADLASQVASDWRGWLAFAGLFVTFLVVADFALRPLGHAHAERLTLWLMSTWRVVLFVFWPLLAPFRWVGQAMGRLNAGPEGEHREEQAEEDIMASLALGELHGQIEESERDMIEKILAMDDLTAEEIMTPRTEMHAVAVDEGLEGALAKARETGHSRLPVFRENRDDIIGICYVKDLIGLDHAALPEFEQTLRPALFVPATKKVSELLAELRKDRVHMAVILDEYGGTAGLVTFEDLIEVVFGKIADEYDQVEEDEVRQEGADRWDMDARLKVSEINERYDFNFPESENYESLGGLVTAELGRIPEVGSQWQNDDTLVTVLEATDRRVVRVRIERRRSGREEAAE